MRHPYLSLVPLNVARTNGTQPKGVIVIRRNFLAPVL